MAKEEPKKIEEPKTEVGLVTLQGEVGLGMRMPDGNVVELNNIDVGMAQVLSYLVTTISDIKKNIG